MELVVFVVILLAAFVSVVYFVAIYNALLVVANNINKAWVNIDVLLKQRHDELPKLTSTCQGCMAHEQGVFDRIAKAREALASAQGPAAKGTADGELGGALRQLFALTENYPDLKAQTLFQQLQGRISEIESQLADRREFYNDSVNTYNIRIASVPDVIVAGFMHLMPHEMFQAADSDRDDVKFEFKPAN